MNRYYFLLLVMVIPAITFCGKRNDARSVQVTDFNGIEAWLTRESDTIYVVNFWATWCTPCVKEFTCFERAHNEFQGKKVKILMVNLDFPDQLQSRVIPFLERRKSALHVIMLDDPDQNTWINRVDTNWSGALPATLIYTKGYRQFYESELNSDQLKNGIEMALTKNK